MRTALAERRECAACEEREGDVATHGRRAVGAEEDGGQGVMLLSSLLL